MLRVRVEDVHGNAAERTVVLVGVPQSAPDAAPQLPGAAIRYDQPFLFSDSTGLRVEAPADAFYEDAWFPCYAAVDGGWQVGNDDLPVRQPLVVELPANAGCGARGHVALHPERGGKFSAEPARLLAGGGVRFTTRTLGAYHVACDTIGPRVAIRSTRPNALPERPGTLALQFEVSDDLSGVEEVQAWADGCWLRVHWDPKMNRAHYLLEDGRHLPGAAQEVLVEARDAAGNVTEWRGRVSWP
jgi:hypothetical protein